MKGTDTERERQSDKTFLLYLMVMTLFGESAFINHVAQLGSSKGNGCPRLSIQPDRDSTGFSITQATNKNIYM